MKPGPGSASCAQLNVMPLPGKTVVSAMSEYTRPKEMDGSRTKRMPQTGVASGAYRLSMREELRPSSPESTAISENTAKETRFTTTGRLMKDEKKQASELSAKKYTKYTST